MRYISIIISLVLCLTLLLIGCIVDTVNSEIAIENIENQEDINYSSNNYLSSSTDSTEESTEEPVEDNPTISSIDYTKWSGLGMVICSTNNTSEFDSHVDTLLANGFTEIRVNLQTWNAPWAVDKTKAAAISAVSMGANVIWGVDQWDGTSDGYPEFPPITAANWEDYRQAILDAAQWAQDNGIYEFQIGNEAGNSIDGTTMTIPQLITNLKALATDVKQIFTNGNISYSCLTTYIPNWIAAGKGDIDIIASNVYMGGNGVYSDKWKTRIDNLVNAFGVGGTYLTEFAPSYSSLEDYSTDEAVQAEAVTEMIEYIKASGIKRALYYCWHDYPGGVFGAVKDDGTYRLLWNRALLNTGP